MRRCARPWGSATGPCPTRCWRVRDLLAEISERPGTARPHGESGINNGLERSPAAPVARMTNSSHACLWYRSADNEKRSQRMTVSGIRVLENRAANSATAPAGRSPARRVLRYKSYANQMKYEKGKSMNRSFSSLSPIVRPFRRHASQSAWVAFAPWLIVTIRSGTAKS